MFWKNLPTWKNVLGIVSSNEQTDKYFLKDENVSDTGYRDLEMKADTEVAGNVIGPPSSEFQVLLRSMKRMEESDVMESDWGAREGCFV